jgi:hypothetical protein
MPEVDPVLDTGKQTMGKLAPKQTNPHGAPCGFSFAANPADD